MTVLQQAVLRSWVDWHLNIAAVLAAGQHAAADGATHAGLQVCTLLTAMLSKLYVSRVGALRDGAT